MKLVTILSNSENGSCRVCQLKNQPSCVAYYMLDGDTGIAEDTELQDVVEGAPHSGDCSLIGFAAKDKPP